MPVAAPSVPGFAAPDKVAGACREVRRRTRPIGTGMTV
jgi:hypothetical protein